MYKAVQVKIREAGKVSYFNINDNDVDVGDYVIVQADRGLEYGQVISEIETVLEDDVEGVLHNIVRKATPHDMKQIRENDKKCNKTYKIALKKIREHQLPMKLIEVEYSFDRSKIIFYFTADGRIDFRELVKDMASVFKARIELKQIGVRDEAKFLGGIGPCGRTLCCTKFLKDFEPITVRMAKDQKLPLTSSKISGLCGRLMCCLSFEYKAYREMLKKLPKEGEIIKTETGKGKILDIDVISRTASVELEDERIVKVKFDEEGKKINA